MCLYLALAITPNEISLREWVGDAVTELASASVTSQRGAWYDVTVHWDGAELSVSRGPRGGALSPLFSAETTLSNTSTNVGFGVGEKADYNFDDVRFFDPTATGEQSTVGRRYAYDALGRRVSETTFENGVAATKYFVYDGNRIIEELDGNGNLVASYVFGPYVDEVLAMRRDTDPGTPGLETFYYLHDDQFNVLALTDAAGNIVERYEYGDYGEPTVYDATGALREDKTSAFGNVYMFQGRQYDAATGLYYYRTRYLDPVQGRFIGRDSIGVWGDANNLGNPYTFVGNNPWTYTDPNGEFVETAWDAFSLGVGFVSLGNSLYQGDWGGAALDTLGIVADGVATAVPFIPGGAGAAIKASRVISAVDTGVNVALSTAGVVEAAAAGDARGVGLNALGIALGAKSLGGAGAKVPDLPTGARAGRGYLDADAALAKNFSHTPNTSLGAEDISQANIIRALRSNGTPEARATEKLMKRGKTQLSIVDNANVGWVGQKPHGSNLIVVNKANLDSAHQAAGVAAHETKHWLQKLDDRKYNSNKFLYEKEAFEFGFKVDPNARKAYGDINEFIQKNYR